MSAIAVSTEETILEAARKVFMQKGFAAARMCEIAKIAGINQALLHYYFRSKDRLFEVIFAQQSQNFYANIISILHSDVPFFEKLRMMIAKEIEKISSAPYLPMFILNEMHSNPERMQCNGSVDRNTHFFKTFSELVEKEYEAGRIRKVCPQQLFLSIMGITMFPFLAQPMIKMALEIDGKSFEQLMQERAEHASELIIRSLQV
ncbi:MAG: TetR/AcrR family transcriptional regulator [Lewinellaceae bacterium]|nr:TetR/AcrR family transcriptional regulator [Lewinellaceae bacterium]MBP6812377.1 TetR/AcrR family transcriptional regulator [Saprospiraceae bacterium]